jgi:hypothetical protein
MLRPSTSHDDAAPDDRAAATANRGQLSIDAASRRLIASDSEPRWGHFLRAWQAVADAKGAYPARSEIDPAQLGAKLLPNVFLVDVVGGADSRTRFRFRLLGQAILERETTRAGAFLDEIGASADIAAIERQYRAAIEGEVSIRTASLVWNDARKDMFKYDVMILPLADCSGDVSNLIGLALYDF